MSGESRISYEDNFKGWSVNAKIKFGDTGAGVSAKLSGTGINPRKWKYGETFKYTDKETGITTGIGRYVDAKGTGYSVSTSRTSGTMPLPLPNGTQIDDFQSLNWSLSYSGEVGNWKNLLEAVVTAAAIVGLIAFLAWLAGNDTTVAGVLDDAAIPGVLAALKSLVENFGQCLPQILNNTACGLE